MRGIMKAALFCAVVLICARAFPTAGAAEGVEDESCPVVGATPSPEQYQRVHQIPTTNHENLPMVTPGGMILEVPKMVAATDVLTVIGRDESALCFRLVTFGPNHHQCELFGVARSESGPVYAFRDEGSAIRLTILNADQIRVEPMGATDRRKCVIEAATYTRAGSRPTRSLGSGRWAVARE